jgi:anti-sigma regulatory factor (Ser/Thr protein kinase)/anti-anti-sigma regulatory factor
MSDLTSTVDRDLDSGVITLRFAGDLTLAATPTMRTALLKGLAECPLALVVDLAELTVTSPVALTVLVAAQRRPRNGPPVALLVCTGPERPSAVAVRLMIGGALPVYRDRTEALAAMWDRPESLQRVRVHLPGRPASAGTAREVIAAACAEWGLAHLVDNASLIVSELVSNVVRHARTDFELTVTLRRPYLHLSVRDGSPEVPVGPPESAESATDEPSYATSGRGMRLIQACASGWGVTVVGDGKIVWATLRVLPI